MGAQCFSIIGSDAGIQTNVKPYLIPEKAFQDLQNAYVYRERVIKRGNLKLLGRLRRVLTAQALGNTDGAGNFSGNIKVILGLESTASIEANASTNPLTVTVGAQVFTETVPADGDLSNGAAGTGTINYATGALTIDTDPDLAGTPVTISFNYFPGLPVMGIFQREIAIINSEETIWFDTKYAYKFSATGFAELSPGTTWQGLDSDFFWCYNYRGVLPFDRLFFATNFNNSSLTPDPIRYYNGIWNDFAPLVSSIDRLYQARIIVAYYGRLLALNVWEGTDAGGQTAASNYFNRCRFSQIGNPVDPGSLGPYVPGSWSSDVFGRGGFIDCPTNEAIISAGFIKNTLIVFFEKTTWQLRYVGEYGLPFLWERVSSDFGSESTNSTVLFDNGVLAVGDKAIITANALGVNRIDLQIPDVVFDIRNASEGVKRVIGVRDYPRELVYWCYSDADLERTFPNTVLVYNYRNATYAFFRDSVTFLGTFQPSFGITWSRTDIFWNDFGTLWDSGKSQSDYPFIVSGNQQGYCHYYNDDTSQQDDESLYIAGITLSDPVRLNITNHNLEDDEIIYLTDIIFDVSTDMNDRLYKVVRVDDNNIDLMIWNTLTQSYDNFVSSSVGSYIGNGQVTLFPQLFIQTKDFNPFIAQGNQLKLMYVDFLMDDTENEWTVQLYVNSSLSTQANMLVGNTNTTTELTSPYYVPASKYAWQRFYATAAGQFVSLVFTYDDEQMNTLETHQHDWELNSMNLWVRQGGKVIF